MATGAAWASVKGQRLVHGEHGTTSSARKSYKSIVSKSYQRKKEDYREAEEGETPKRMGIL
jgi:hypothetical protein